MGGITALIVWVAAGLICYAIAENKGRNPILALAFGLLFGVFSLLYYIFSPGSENYEAARLNQKIHQKNESERKTGGFITVRKLTPEERKEQSQ